MASEDMDDTEDQDQTFEGGRTEDEEDQQSPPRDISTAATSNTGAPTVTDTETGEVEPSVSTSDRTRTHRPSDALSLDTTIAFSVAATTGQESTDVGKRKQTLACDEDLLVGKRFRNLAWLSLGVISLATRF
jgi:hypothetical protein